jgi:Bacterial EndoU nuclease
MKIPTLSICRAILGVLILCGSMEIAPLLAQTNNDWMRRQQQEQIRQQQRDQARNQAQEEARQQQRDHARDQARQQQRESDLRRQREEATQRQRQEDRQRQQAQPRPQRDQGRQQQTQQPQQQQQRALGTVQPGSNKPTGMVFSNGVARLARPLTAAEISRGFTGKVTPDGRALVKFQNRVFIVPASRIAGLSARLAMQKQHRAASLAATAQRTALNEQIRKIAVVSAPPPSNHTPHDAGNSPPARGGGGNGGNNGGGGNGDNDCANPPCTSFNEAAKRPGPVQVVASPVVQARIDAARVARLQDRNNERTAEKAGQQVVSIDFAHVIGADIRADGTPTGGHSLESGDVRVVPGTESMPDSTGVYQAKVEIRDRNNPSMWIEKRAKEHTMFPKSWSAERIKVELEGAWMSKELHPEKPGMWQGETPSGVKVEGFLTPRITAYPLYREGR